MSGGTREPEPNEEQAVPRGKVPLKERLSELFSEYGGIALYTYLTLSVLTIAGFSIAVGLGYKPTTSTGVIGVIITGWVLAKATMPIRILITLALTPVIAPVVDRLRRKTAADSHQDAASSENDNPNDHQPH